MSDSSLAEAIRPFLDAAWYLLRYPDVSAAGLDPLDHFIAHGVTEGRDPNPFFDSPWYLAQNPDVAASGLHPLIHYMEYGAAELRNPHPRFDATFYAEEHPDAARNPLLYHLILGRKQGWATEPTVSIADYLPSVLKPTGAPDDIAVDIIIPVYRGLEQTRRCIESVLADPERLPGNVIVIDDKSPEPKLSAWLDQIDGKSGVLLIRNVRNLGFVGAANKGLERAGRHDAILLNSDTEVPRGWMRRLAAHAYSGPRVGTVSPFSNNATICSYPSPRGGTPAFGLGVAALDAAARTANAGRAVDVPTTVGYCMYLRRACLDEIGMLDAQTFGRGYGEENDFCMRASLRGWRHLLACDTFVFHEGEVSFGTDAPEQKAGLQLLVQRYPNYPRLIEQHVRRDAAGPARFALTGELFRRSGLPTVLMVSHSLGGGVLRHIERLVAKLRGQANVLLMEATAHGVALSVPALEDHPTLRLPAERVPDLLTVLRAQPIARVHVHHVAGLGIHLRALIHALGVPFDFTAHDYFPICPQINLLPLLDEQYCGEPAPAGCNACIARRPNFGARDILSWRKQHAWLLTEAERVLCPSEDTRARLARYGLDERGVVAPHESVRKGPWKLAPAPLPRGRKLRIALIGVLADQKGLPAVAAVAEAADAGAYEFHLIGYTEKPLASPLRERIPETGEYKDADLQRLLAQAKPHIAWFPAQWPETYSYTLSAALEAGLPVVASDIGAFRERLAGRPMTRLVDPAAPAEDWIAAFEELRGELQGKRPAAKPRQRRLEPDFYADHYGPPPLPAPAVRTGPVDLRRPGRTSVLVVPERFEGGVISPCAYIRLLQPLDHPAIGAGFDVVLAEPGEALRYRADILATHRYAVPDNAGADRLAAHCRENGIRLLYDLDDDLLNIPREHPEAAMLRPRAKTVERMVRHADAVWVSTPQLRASLAPLRRDARVVANGLDERLWSAMPHPRPSRDEAMRVLIMGTATHGEDLAMVMPALERLAAGFEGRITFDLIGVTEAMELPPWLRRLHAPPSATGSYPGFVNWITGIPGWDVGITPLVDSPFNAAKSAIKTMDYAALGLAVLASNVPAYQGSLADGPGGMLLPNDPAAWHEALLRLLRAPRLRRSLATGARRAFAESYTLAAQAEQRRTAWLDLLRKSRSAAAQEKKPAKKRAA